MQISLLRPSLRAWTVSLGIGVLSVTGAVHAQQYPDKPVKIIVPYVAGSPADTVARTLGEGLATRLGQPVIVDNKPGANALIGTREAARAAPDGYTLVIGNLDTQALNPLLYKQAGYEPTRDFAPVVLVSRPTLLLVARPGLPVNSGAELIALAKAQPGKLSYGTWGLGSVAHLWGIQLEQTAGVDMLHVPFQGSPAAATALMGNQIDLMFMSPAQALPSAQQGKLKIIGATAAQRVKAWEQIPTLSEQGFRGYEGQTWFGILAPARTPPEIVERLNRELDAVLKAPETVQRFAGMAMNPEGGAPQRLAETLKSSSERWKQVIAEKKIQLDQ